MLQILVGLLILGIMYYICFWEYVGGIGIFSICVIVVVVVVINTICVQFMFICLGILINFIVNIGGILVSIVNFGNNYGCLFMLFNFFWYYLKIVIVGSLIVDINVGFDVDFVIWGFYVFFFVVIMVCNFYLVFIDCFYFILVVEQVNVVFVVVNQVYVLLVINYVNMVQNIMVNNVGGMVIINCVIVFFVGILVWIVFDLEDGIFLNWIIESE